MSSIDCCLLIIGALWMLSGLITLGTGGDVAHRVWQWEETICETNLLVESAFCKNCEIYYDVDDEYYDRVTFKNGCPTSNNKMQCWYNNSDHGEVTFEHPIRDQSWATWKAFQVFGIIFLITTIFLGMFICWAFSEEMTSDYFNYENFVYVMTWIGVLSFILFLIGVGMAVYVEADSLRYDEYDLCEVSFNFTNEGCKICYVKTPERHVFLNSCPENDSTCWAKKDNRDVVTFNDPKTVLNYNYSLVYKWLLVLGSPGMLAALVACCLLVKDS